MSRQHGIPLLDVNVLVALAWPNHVHHHLARTWFAGNHADGWATTPFTEAGFVRVSSNRAVITSTTTPALAQEQLVRMCALGGHEFWPDDVRLVTGDQADIALLRSHRDVTDGHLLALAARNHGRLVTFDGRIRRLLGEQDADAAHLDIQSV